MMPSPLEDFIQKFEERFSKYLIEPNTERFAQPDLDRMIVRHRHVTLPAESRASDWDVYCWANPDVLTVDVLKEMRAFYMAAPQFELMRDYATSHPAHVEARAFQSTGEKLYHVQFMGTMVGETYAPFVDMHVLNVPAGILHEFYKEICDDAVSQGYLDWSVLTIWRKTLKSGEFRTDTTIYQRSVVPALAADHAELIAADPFAFFDAYFSGRAEFAPAVSFLKGN